MQDCDGSVFLKFSLISYVFWGPKIGKNSQIWRNFLRLNYLSKRSFYYTSILEKNRTQHIWNWLKFCHDVVNARLMKCCSGQNYEKMAWHFDTMIFNTWAPMCFRNTIMRYDHLCIDQKCILTYQMDFLYLFLYCNLLYIVMVLFLIKVFTYMD